MKKNFLYILSGVLGLLLLIGCSDDEKFPPPTPLDANTIVSEAKPGSITLKWAIPEDANYKYIKITYTLPETGKECMRLASVYSDSLVVDNLLKRYGDIEFTLQPCSEDGKGGDTYKIVAQAGAAQKTIKLESTNKPFQMTGKDDAWSDHPETSEGSLPALFDGITDQGGNFFHLSWSQATPFPHYIVFDLKENASAFRFSYYGRNNANRDNPKEMDILVSNDFENTPEYYANETGTRLIASLSGLPDAKNAHYESANLTSETSFRYVWFKIKSATSGQNWVALGEMSVFRTKKSIYDPETGETTVLD